jgi:hypothetical protein
VKDKDEQIVEMNNGCLCCTVRGDLGAHPGRPAQKKKPGQAQVRPRDHRDHGARQPRARSAQTFFMDEAIHDQYLLDAVVTGGRREARRKQLDEHDEARRQVGLRRPDPAVRRPTSWTTPRSTRWCSACAR